MTSIGIQVIADMAISKKQEQLNHFRDARISPNYEGTNGIQAIDLVGRKVPMNRAVIKGLLNEIQEFGQN